MVSNLLRVAAAIQTRADAFLNPSPVPTSGFLAPLPHFLFLGQLAKDVSAIGETHARTTKDFTVASKRLKEDVALPVCTRMESG